MTESKDFHPTVVAGAEWLDVNGPADWPDRINIELLNMFSNCVLDMVFFAEAEAPERGYEYALHSLGLESVPGPCGFAFDLTPNYPHLSPDALRDEWVRYIEHRRAEVVA